MITTSWWDRDWVRTSYGNVIALEPHKAVWNAGERLHEEQGEDRRSRAEAALYFYNGGRHFSLNGSGFVGDGGGEPPHRNVVQMCCDTRTAHIVRNKVRVFFLTSAGDTEAQERAKGMTKAVEATFDDQGIYGHKGGLVCQDGGLFDCGAAKVTVDYASRRVLIDRVFPWEVYVPLEEARLGAPRQMFHRSVVDRRVLLAMFPEHEESIKDAPSCPDDWRYSAERYHDDTSDLVAVWEAWHLPSGSVDLDDRRSFGTGEDGELDASLDPRHDGRHVVAIENATLSDRPWPFDYFPIALFRPNPDPIGYYSRSVAQTLRGIQLELIKLGRRIQALIHLHAVPRLVVARRAKLNKQAVSNDYASILEVSSSTGDVMYLNPNAVPAVLFQREQELVDAAMQLVGISELSAFAQKPAGVDHAPGMQMLADVESIRHTPAFRAWEDFHLDLARAVVDGFRQLAEHDPGFEVMFGDSKDLQAIKWKEVDLERSKYKIRRWPTNLLPSTPAAKASMIAQLTQQGVFTPQQALTAMQSNPDIEALLGDTTAMQKNIDRKLEIALRDGDLTDESTPNAYMDLALCKTSAATAINRAEANGVPDEKVDGLRKFWEFAHRLELRMQDEAAKAAAGQLPPEGAPPGGGVPAPPPGEQAPPLAA